jgi:hypothetical protein
MNTTEIFLIAIGIIFCVPFVASRLGRTEYFAPLVVWQIATGLLPGPGALGAAVPEYHAFVLNPQVSFGAAHYCVTGSRQHDVAVRRLALKK